MNTVKHAIEATGISIKWYPNDNHSTTFTLKKIINISSTAALMIGGYTRPLCKTILYRTKFLYKTKSSWNPVHAVLSGFVSSTALKYLQDEA